MNVVDSVWLPALTTVPDTGLYTKLPGVLEVASSCDALSAAPLVIAAGVGQLIVGVALFTVSVTLLVAVLKSVVSVGVNVTDSVWLPAPGVVPAAGLYAKLPAVLAVASSCVALSVVPYVMAVGVGQVMVGVVFGAAFTVNPTLLVAVLKSVVSVGVNVTDSVWLPAPGVVPAEGLYAKLPAVLAVASSCVALSAVPLVIAAGVGQLIVGVALLTVSATLPVAVLKSVVSVGVNVTDSVWLPAPRVVPAAGEYAKLPAVLAVASSCAPLNAVPYVIPAGVGQVMVGVVFGAAFTVNPTLPVAVL